MVGTGRKLKAERKKGDNNDMNILDEQNRRRMIMDLTVGLENKSIEELYEINKQLVALIRDKEREREREARGQFAIGDRIWFRRTKNGEIIHGTVQGINQNTLKVQKIGSHIRWAVSPSMCHKEFEQIFHDNEVNYPMNSRVSSYSLAMSR